MKKSYLLFSIILLTIAVALIYSCGEKEEASSRKASQTFSTPTFVGDQECASCHASEFEDWQESHHDYAMKKATEEFVRGDFSNVVFNHKGETYRFFKKDSAFFVEYGTGSGKQVYEVSFTFGWEPLQQYLVEFGKGKLQALNIAWDTNKEQWFALNPEEDIKHGDWLHWTGGAMNWNTMCASCHSTNLQKNYIADTDSFNTTWSSINVSCESCHGPGGAHVDFANSERIDEATVERIREDLKLTKGTSQGVQINQCAQCHSLREQITDNYNHQGEFLDHFNPTLPHPSSYFADGQIKEEVYVYGSFLQSKMFKEGVACNDCHDPHSLDLKANVTDNTLCMQCHEPRYNTAEHLIHKPNTEATQCVSCHMPGRLYMEVDFRRDHSFRVPRPDLSVKYDTPNACNNCHTEKSAEWAAKAVDEKYGDKRPQHFSEVLAKADAVGEEALPELKQLVSDTINPDIARATAIWYIGEFPSEGSLEQLRKSLNDESPLVRKSAAQVLSDLPPEMKNFALQDALDDSLRVVRNIAAGGLAHMNISDVVGSLKSHFRSAMEEHEAYLSANQYFPQGEMNRGQYFEKQGRLDDAIESYERALEKDSLFNPARINLAHAYNRRGENGKAEELLNTVVAQESSYGPAYYSLALLLAEEDKYESAIPNFEKAAELMPENHRVRYNQAIAFQTLKETESAEQAYLKAIELAPQNPDYRYGICTLYLQEGKAGSALPHAKKLAELLPNNSQAQALLQRIKAAGE